MPAASRRPFGQNYAFVVAGAIFLALLAAAGLRAAPGVLILPLEKAFHWDRASISTAAGGAQCPQRILPRSPGRR